MKKYIVFLLAFVLMLLPLNANAAQDALEVTGGSVTPGETIYITVSLKSGVTGDSMGISCTYDPKVLEPMPAASFWEHEGVLQDFSENGDGVWTIDAPMELKGQVCVVAFRALKEAEATKTQVACKLMVKNGAKDVGTFEATADITLQCNHVFGTWYSDGNINHAHSCTDCGLKETTAHQWNEGTRGTGAQQGKLVYLCAICGAQKVVDLTTGDQEVIPQQFVDQTYNSDSENTQPGTEITTDPHAGHDHANEGAAPAQGNQKGQLWIAFAITAGVALVLAAVIFLALRKKKK